MLPVQVEETLRSFFVSQLQFCHLPIFSLHASCVDKSNHCPPAETSVPRVNLQMPQRLTDAQLKVKTSQNKRQIFQLSSAAEGSRSESSTKRVRHIFPSSPITVLLKGVHLKPLEVRRGADLFQVPALIPPFRVNIRFAKGSRTKGRNCEQTLPAPVPQHATNQLL